MRRQQPRERPLPGCVEALIVDRTKGAEAGVVNHDVKAVELTGYFRDYAPDFVRIEHVEAPALSLATAGLNFVDDGAEASFVDISNRRHRAFLCEQVSRRAPHPT